MSSDKAKLQRSLSLAETTLAGVGIILHAGVYALVGERRLSRDRLDGFADDSRLPSEQRFVHSQNNRVKDLAVCRHLGSPLNDYDAPMRQGV